MSASIPGSDAGPWEQSRAAFEQQGLHRVHIVEVFDHAAAAPAVEEQSDEYCEGGQQQLRKKEFKRAWREEWKSKHRWVFPIRNSDGELRLKCQWCMLYNMDNVFAREGCSTIQMSALNTHAKSEAHRTAEGRVTGTDMSLATFSDSLFDGGGTGAVCKTGSETSSREGPAAAAASHMEADLATPVAKKRKFTSSVMNKETLASIIQKNNSRIVHLLGDAEAGRNARHDKSLAIAKKHLKLEEQRLHLEQKLLEQDRARLNDQVAMGKSLIAALSDLAEGLKTVGNALEGGH